MRMPGWMVLVAGLSVAGCDGERPPNLAPTPIPQPETQPQPVQVQLTGTVYDSAFRPVAAARVEVVEGPQVGLAVTTNGQGGFTLFGSFDDTTRLRASKEGHVEGTEALSPSCPSCSPTRRYTYFYLAVLAPPVSIAGDYTLTFVADAACSGVPEALRTRTYPVTIAAAQSSRNPADTMFWVTASGAPMLGGHASFPLGVAGNSVTLQFGDHGPYLVEELGDNAYVAFDGQVEVLVDAPAAHSISTKFHGWANYCQGNAPMSQYYDCRPAPGTVSVACESRAHQLALTRR